MSADQTHPDEKAKTKQEAFLLKDVEPISTTRLAALFPLLVFVLWLIILVWIPKTP